jgi:hypothetical protein
MACPICATGKQHGSCGEMKVVVEFSTGAVGCTDPADLLKQIVNELRVNLKAGPFKIWEVKIQGVGYRPFKPERDDAVDLDVMELS